MKDQFKIFILAGSSNQYINFIKLNNLDPERFIHVFSEEKAVDVMVGCEEYSVLKIGTWYELERRIVRMVEDIERAMLAKKGGDDA